MMRSTMKSMWMAGLAVLLLGGCDDLGVEEPEEVAEEIQEDIEEDRGLAAPAGEAAQEAAEPAGFAGVDALVAQLHPTEGNAVKGTVHFTQAGDGVKIVAHVEGLSPGKHGFHAHELGDCTAPDGTSAGGHYNPEDVAHALPPTEPRHAGDFGNLEANEDGMAHFEGTFPNVSLADSDEPLLGRGIIVHANPDDGGQPTGNAGPRVACGVIGVAEGGGMAGMEGMEGEGAAEAEAEEGAPEGE